LNTAEQGSRWFPVLAFAFAAAVVALIVSAAQFLVFPCNYMRQLSYEAGAVSILFTVVTIRSGFVALRPNPGRKRALKGCRAAGRAICSYGRHLYARNPLVPLKQRHPQAQAAERPNSTQKPTRPGFGPAAEPP